MNTYLDPCQRTRESKAINWLYSLKQSKILLVSAIVVLVMVVFLVIYLLYKFDWLLWIYAFVCSLSLAYLIYQYLRIRKTLNYNREAELQETINTITQDNLELSRIIEDLKQEKEILKQSLEENESKSVIEKYTDIFELLQTLNRCVEGLPSSVQTYIDTTQEEISRVLSSYGFSFIDLSPNCLYC